MDLEDRITIGTPEGVELQLVLAGAGSRFVAAAIDFAVQILLIVLAAVVAFALIGGGVGEALFFIAVFASLYLYFILFEVLASGRTPGKRMTRLRVVRERGAPVDLAASAIRNLLRLIDLLPTAYLVGLFAIVLTKRNQRLGDLAAGTLVIREPKPNPKADATSDARANKAAQEYSDSAGWDVSAVSSEELAAVRRFLQRSESLDRRARRELAYRLEQGLRSKVSGAPAGLEPELFLQTLVREKSRR